MQISKNITKYTLALLGIIVFLSSCEKEYEKIEDIDDAKIQAYIKKNNIPAIKDPSGFYYQILEQGTGGTLLNKDSVFYSSVVNSLTGTNYYTPSAYYPDGNYLGYVNPSSYRTAMYSINRGGKVRIIVPSYLAFGKNGQGTIPSNEVIVSEISVFPQGKRWELEDKIITDFIAAKGLTGFTKHPSRVYQSVSTVGTGATINAFSTITVKYKGRYLNGTVFDESPSDNMTSPLSSLIRGWQKVLIGSKAGAKMRIIVPSDLGYGSNTETGIIAHSLLDFDIEIVTVTNSN